MLIRSITAVTLVIAFSSVSASEIVLRLPAEFEEAHKTPNPNDAIIWKPISNGLSGFTLTLPKYGVNEALEYQDTASLFYLTSVDNTGLSLVKDKKGEFEFSFQPKLSAFQYSRAVTPVFSFGIGAEFNAGDNRPFLAGEFRSVTGRRGLQQRIVQLSKASLDLLFTSTELSANENAEKILSLSLNSSQGRLGFGRRWFEVIHEANLLAEIGLIDEGIGFGLQVERTFNFSTAYIGSFTNAVSKETETFWGIKYEFGHGSQLKLESNRNLVSSYAQSLGSTRRSALPGLWRDNISISKR